MFSSTKLLAAFVLAVLLTLLPHESRAQSRPQAENEEWSTILRVASTYDRESRRRANYSSLVFSAIFERIATTSYRHRRSSSELPSGERWAGALVRGALLAAAHDIAQRPDYWYGFDQSAVETNCRYKIGALQREGGRILTDLLLYGPLGSMEGLRVREDERTLICQGYAKGTTHFEEHLAPYFNVFFDAVVESAMSGDGDPVRRTSYALRIFCSEHDAFLRVAVGPAFAIDQELGMPLAFFSGLYSQSQAKSLRNQSIDGALQDAARAYVINAMGYHTIMEESGCFP